MPDNGVEILLVEDNPNDVKLTLYAFKRINLLNKVVVARDGVEALEILFPSEGGAETATEAALPRLILLDLKLPRVDGLEVLRRVKADERTRMIPVVVLTTSREERDIVESYRLGVNSYIVKPVDFEQFIESTRSLGMYWLLLNQPPVEP